MAEGDGGGKSRQRVSRERTAQALLIVAVGIWWLMRGGPHGGLQRCAEDFGNVLTAIIKGAKAGAAKLHH